jgi:WD40 repeat protein/tRNA A-37 threonylcarbamoyl transferase component Bud32
VTIPEEGLAERHAAEGVGQVLHAGSIKEARSGRKTRGVARSRVPGYPSAVPDASGGQTEFQPDDSRSESARRSLPENVSQDPRAPKVAGYLLASPLGRGAYAEVWKAWQERTRKWVAVKVFTRKSGVDWLFLQREVERLIRLDKHPGVVSLLDADLDGEVPFYAMDYMEGGSLERFADPANRADPVRAAAWLEQMAEALAYVHSKGLIHCDLKPANVLLDDEGRVRLADFGQSRIVTDSSGALGTLFYMAPEQAVVLQAGEPLQPDVRWDVFALGATLWAILCGATPRADEEVRAALTAAPSLEERLRVYRDLVARRPLADCRAAGAAADEDLAAIVARAAKARPEERYPSVQAVLDDLRARRAGRPVSPLAHDRGYRARKFLRRNAALVAVAAAAAVALGAAGVQIVRERDAARRELSLAYLARARNASARGDWASAALFDARADQVRPSDLARWNAASALADLRAPDRTVPAEGATFAAVSPDFRVLARATSAQLTLFDWKTLKPLAPPIPFPRELRAAAFSADSARVVTADGKGALRVWDARTGKPARRGVDGADASPGEASLVRTVLIGRVIGGSLAAGPGGGLIASSAYYHACRIWDAATGKEVGSPAGFGVEAVAFSPTGTAAASAGYKDALVWSVSPGGANSNELKFDGTQKAVAFSPDGERLAIGGEDGFSLWNAQTLEKLGAWRIGGAAVTCVGFGPKGKTLVVGTEDGRAVRWDAQAGAELGPRMLLPGPADACSISPDGAQIAVASGGTVRVWTPARPRPRRLRPPAEFVQAGQAAFSADGRTILVIESTDKTFDSFEAATLAPRGAPVKPAVSRMLDKLFLSPDASLALLSDFKGNARLWDRAARRFRGPWRALGDNATAATFSPDGRTVLISPWGKPPVLWRTDDGTPVGGPLATGGAAWSAAFTPDSRRVLTAGDGGVRVWDAATGAPDGAPLWTGKYAGGAAASPDGRLLAAGTGRVFRVWDARTLEPAGPPVRVPSGRVDRLVFGPRGRRLLVGTSDDKLRLWDARTWRPAGQAMSHGDAVHAARFLRGGRLVLTASWDKTVRLWDAESGEPVGDPMRHESGVTFANLSPDERLLLSGGGSAETVRLWDLSWLDDGDSPGALVRRAEALTGRRLTARGDAELTAAPED